MPRGGRIIPMISNGIEGIQWILRSEAVAFVPFMGQGGGEAEQKEKKKGFR